MYTANHNQAMEVMQGEGGKGIVGRKKTVALQLKVPLTLEHEVK